MGIKVEPNEREIKVLTEIFYVIGYCEDHKSAENMAVRWIKHGSIVSALADFRAEPEPPSDDREVGFNQDQTAWNLAAWIHDNIIMHAEAFDSESDKLDVMAGEFHAALSAARGNRAELEAAAGEVVLQRKNHAIILNKDIDGDFIAALNALAVLTSEVGE